MEKSLLLILENLLKHVVNHSELNIDAFCTHTQKSAIVNRACSDCAIDEDQKSQKTEPGE
jgi:hypothetical protein